MPNAPKTSRTPPADSPPTLPVVSSTRSPLSAAADDTPARLIDVQSVAARFLAEAAPAAAAATSLVPLETSAHRLSTTRAAAYLHNGWKPQRQKLLDAMIAGNVADSRIRRFCTCGDAAQVEVHEETGRLRIRTGGCNDRCCIVCGRRRALLVEAALNGLLCTRPVHAYTFATLTIAGRPNVPLAESVSRLYDGFRDLRRLKLWKKNVHGGIAVCEIKWSARANAWHPHLHLLMDARYVEQAAISDHWRAVTGDSFRVDLRRVRGNQRAASYLSKYVTKPISTTCLGTATLAAEAVAALKGRRLAFCFGAWYGTPLSKLAESDEVPDESPELWRPVAALQDLLAAADAGDDWARSLVRDLPHRQRSDSGPAG